MGILDLHNKFLLFGIFLTFLFIPFTSAITFDSNMIETVPFYQGQFTSLHFGTTITNDTNIDLNFTTIAYVNDSNFYTQTKTVPDGNTYYNIIDLNSSLIPFGDYNILIKMQQDNNSDVNYSHTYPLSVLPPQVSGIDLAVYSQDVVAPELKPNVQKTITAKIRNIGSQDANNVEVRVYTGAEYSESNLLYLDTIASIPAGTSKDISFSIFPTSPGIVTLNIEADYDNKIAESNENNNKIQKGLSVARPVAEGFTAFTVSLDIAQECVVLLSNGERLVSKGIYDSNSGYVVDISVVSGAGKELFKGKLSEGEEINLEGRTIRPLLVTQYLAKVMLVYQEQQQVVYNNCVVDLEKVQNEAKAVKESFKKCQADLSKTQAELTSYLSTKNLDTQKLTDCQAELSSCNTNKSTLETNLALKQDKCSQDILKAKQDEKDKYDLKADALNQTIAEKQKEAQDAQNTTFYLKILLASIIFAFFGAVLYWWKSQGIIRFRR